MALADKADQPRAVRNGVGSVEQHSLADQIALDKYLADKSAVANPRRGARFSRLVPPAAI